ncbi:hypothetical protein F2Q70_00041149 [Brassica cretica]|uniref:SAC domain-containing protein n=1 Tax=Brassica cretica TaxID=69181 RepID=A0A8S9K2V2_BRACR|nr:hypothetical protein F2Q70_00041149 [Brassica cretica]
MTFASDDRLLQLHASLQGNGQKTSIVVITLDSNEVYIISSLFSRPDTQVIYIDPTTGILRYNGKPGLDNFKSEREAVDYITNGSRGVSRSSVYARAILGYAVLGSFGMLLVATKLNPSVPELPGGGCVYTVAESQWVKVPLHNPQPQGKGEVKNIQELTELDIDGKHYFCDTRDITRPFPSRVPVQSPDDEFVWNKWLSLPFKNIGLPEHCVILLQGFAEYRPFGSSGQLEGIVALMARRSRLHPGTRYLARGINSCSGTGNEVECEQLVWTPKKHGQSIAFSSYIWRRGTIPIWWGAELKMTAAEAEIYVAAKDPYKGSTEYYQRLSKRYDTRNLDAPVGENQKKKAFVPIVCINLLRSGEGKSESILVQHFEESMNFIKSGGKLPYTRVHLINYDWHASVKLKGEQQTIEGLWMYLKSPTMAIGITEGDYLPSRQRLKDCRGEVICVDDVEGAFCLRSHQNGVIRFNCADSLDRTNAASFFGGLQVFVEQCRRLGISLDTDIGYGYNSGRPIRDEDIAITGAGARLHEKDTSSLSLLYDFEELEGQLDFLTRVVSVTFYPAGSLKIPMTLGQIEVLGVSLPWKGMFTSERTGGRLAEIAGKTKEDEVPFSSCSDSNPFAAKTLQTETVSTPVQQNDPFPSNLLDLLTGEVSASDPFPQPAVECVASGGNDMLDFLDQAVVQYSGPETVPSMSSSQDKSPRESGSHLYLNCLKSVMGPNMGRKLEFIEAMKLEIERLRLNISAAERDRALLSIGIDPATINPNSSHDEIANALAVLGQASLEDKLIASIGLEKLENSVIDFWNINGIGEGCNGGVCQVRAEVNKNSVGATTKSLGGEPGSVFLCLQCRKKACKSCCAGRGAVLLSKSYSRDNANGGGSLADGSATSIGSDQYMCKNCCNTIVLEALIVDYVRVLVSLRRSGRVDDACREALNEVFGSNLANHLAVRGQPSPKPEDFNVLHQILGQEESLAEFPYASFLHKVETGTDSAPFLSLLTPLNLASSSSYWKAPPSSSSVEAVIILNTLSDVNSVILLVSPCGYSDADAPTVQIWASNDINKETRTLMGKWDVQSFVRSSPELYGPEKSGRAPRHIKFAFKNPIRCRIIWVTLRLPRLGSSSVSLDRNINLLSLDENPFAPPIPRRASFGATTENEPCLHAKRILVSGNSRRDKALASLQSVDSMSVRNWLDRPPRLNRFLIPLEAERPMANDLVLELYLQPGSPLASGFRLDAFTAIKPRVTHSPSSGVVDIWDPTSIIMEDRHVSPAVLYIQVSALQDQYKMVTIAEYRLPEARVGTQMYFDFPKQVQGRRVSFKLLGDVAALADDPAETDDLSGRASPFAAGLSLANRIKLYYYADPYEVGKWASLSAV